MNTAKKMTAGEFKELYLPYHVRLYQVAFRIMGNEADAEDIIQEAYLKLWNKRDGLYAVDNPEAFCISIIKNLCFDQLRSGKVSILRKGDELAECNVEITDDSLETKDEVELVKQLIRKLPEKQRKVIILRDIKDCSFDEIEKFTGMNAINIRVLLSKARKKIREQFKLINHE